MMLLVKTRVGFCGRNKRLSLACLRRKGVSGTYLYGAATLERQLQAILERALAADTARAAAVIVGLDDAMEGIIELEINL